MRRMYCCGVFLSCAALHGAVGQQAMGTQQMSLGQNQSIMASIAVPQDGEPYQAEKVSRSVQTLSDGTVITNETRGLIARDTQGRVREEVYQIHSGNMNGKQMEMQFQSATVGDPVTHTLLMWTGLDTKLAMRMQLPAMPKVPGMAAMLVAPPPPAPYGSNRDIKMIKEDAPPPANLGAPSQVVLGRASASDSTVATMPTTRMPDPSQSFSNKLGPTPDVHIEDLGRQSIEGVLVTGRRTTTTIPAGAIGNDRPIVVTHEEWRSPELKILVKTIDRDPRTGEQTMELHDLNRADPDEALFQAPEGYKVQDLSEMIKGLGNLGRTPPAN